MFFYIKNLNNKCATDFELKFSEDLNIDLTYFKSHSYTVKDKSVFFTLGCMENSTIEPSDYVFLNFKDIVNKDDYQIYVDNSKVEKENDYFYMQPYFSEDTYSFESVINKDFYVTFLFKDSQDFSSFVEKTKVTQVTENSITFLMKGYTE